MDGWMDVYSRASLCSLYADPLLLTDWLTDWRLAGWSCCICQRWRYIHSYTHPGHMISLTHARTLMKVFHFISFSLSIKSKEKSRVLARRQWPWLTPSSCFSSTSGSFIRPRRIFFLWVNLSWASQWNCCQLFNVISQPSWAETQTLSQHLQSYHNICFHHCRLYLDSRKFHLSH